MLEYRSHRRHWRTVAVIGRKAAQFERIRPVRIEKNRLTAPRLPDQRIEPGRERGERLWRRPRALEKRILQHTARRWIDFDRDNVDRRRRWMGFEIEDEEGSQDLGIAHGGRKLQQT